MYIDPNSTNNHIFSDHAISQSTCKDCGIGIGKYQIRCTVCTNEALKAGQINYCGAGKHYVDGAVSVIRRRFDNTTACVACAEKIAIGKEQIAAVTGGGND